MVSMKVIGWTMLILGIITLFILIPSVEIKAQPLAIAESIVLSQLLSEKNVCEGHFLGMANVYYPNGNLFAKVPCENGKLAKDGTAKVYNLDGSLRVEISYKNRKFIQEEAVREFVEESFEELSREPNYVDTKTGALLLESIYFGAKNYYYTNKHYPQSLKDLTSAKPPYVSPRLASTEAYGYDFAIIGTNNNLTFLATASPVSKNITSKDSFCITEDGVARFDSSGNKILDYNICKRLSEVPK